MSFIVGNVQNPVLLVGLSASNAGFSFVPQIPLPANGPVGFQSLPMVAGEIACTSGDAWVRLLKTPSFQTVNGQVVQIANVAQPIVSGPNAALLTYPGNLAFYTDGWLHITAGMSIPFGSDPPSDTAPRDPVGQIDIWTSAGFATEINVIGH